MSKNTKENTYRQSDDSNSKSIQIMFKEDRSYTLYIGKSIYKFKPHEIKTVPATIIKSLDWPHESKYFTVIPVSNRVTK